MCKSLCDSLISKHLFSLKYLSCESNFDLNQSLLVDDSLAGIAVIHKEFPVTNQKGFTFLNIARQPARLQVWLQHFSLNLQRNFHFVLIRFVVVCLIGPNWRYSDIPDIFGQISVDSNLSLRH